MSLVLIFQYFLGTLGKSYMSFLILITKINIIMEKVHFFASQTTFDFDKI
jgi:hypothetical protein